MNFFDDVTQGRGSRANRNMVGDEPIFRSWSWKVARGGTFKEPEQSRQDILNDLDNQYKPELKLEYKGKGASELQTSLILSRIKEMSSV